MGDKLITTNELCLAFHGKIGYSLLIMKKVDMFIEKYHMLEHGDRVIAGISGGADSVCLLFVLLEIREKLGIEIISVHVNHGIRGDSAKKDEQFVQALCREYQVEYIVYHENVESIAKKRKQSVEEAGRFVRREAFEKTCFLYGGTKIAMAHHQNDNAETLLMNLARGTGLKGLGGIQPVAGRMIRPLLCLSRKEIEEYVEAIGCGFCQDETNDEDEYTRNRLRHQVVPILEEQVNSQTVRHMNETMGQIRVLQDYMEIQTAEAYRNCVTELHNKAIGIKTEEYEKQHQALKGLLIQRVLSKLAGAERDITSTHVEAISELFYRQTGKSRNLPYGIVASREYDQVVLRKNQGQVVEQWQPNRLNVPGILHIPEANLSICCTIQEKAEDFSIKHVPQKPYTKWFDYDIIKGNLFVRARKSGDSIVIDKAGKRQKLKSYFVNEKIPSADRNLIPLIADDEQIIWILGYRMSSAYQVSEKTRQILEIKVTEGKNDVREN